MTISLTAVFRAGRTRRWHRNADVSHTIDPIDGHGARVARILLAIHPEPTLDLISAALIHDDGEGVVGDVAAPDKDAEPQFAALLAMREDAALTKLWGARHRRPDYPDTAWIRFADRLDAYMWARHHATHVLDGDGWPDARRWLWAEAERLGVQSQIEEAIA